MKEKDTIPASKVSRAMRFAKAGVKVGGNYVKHYAKRATGSKLDKDDLHAANASDLYEALGEMKGSVLKLAQMMSMDQGVLPTAYAKQFQMAQYSAPPLSGPLVRNTFRKYLGKTPEELFDRFEDKAVAAASIGQVHRAWIGDHPYAVKIQYPGVADSITSDIQMAKPFALRMLSVKEHEVKDYIEEVTSKLLEETDYTLELKQSIELTEQSAVLDHVRFAKYYPAYSSSRILVMDWIEGLPFDKFLATNPDQETRNRVGQALWDFYNFQIHALRKVHADPHPGNFLIDDSGQLWVIDFGCVKTLPDDFYNSYFGMLNDFEANNEAGIATHLENLRILLPTDDPSTRAFLQATFIEMAGIMAQPMFNETFDFGNPAYFATLYARGEELGKDPILRKIGAGRGPKDALYINRTYFGLYSMLHQLNATVNTRALMEKYAADYQALYLAS